MEKVRACAGVYEDTQPWPPAHFRAEIKPDGSFFFEADSGGSPVRSISGQLRDGDDDILLFEANNNTANNLLDSLVLPNTPLIKIEVLDLAGWELVSNIAIAVKCSGEKARTVPSAGGIAEIHPCRLKSITFSTDGNTIRTLKIGNAEANYFRVFLPPKYLCCSRGRLTPIGYRIPQMASDIRKLSGRPDDW